MNQQIPNVELLLINKLKFYYVLIKIQNFLSFKIIHSKIKRSTINMFSNLHKKNVKFKEKKFYNIKRIKFKK